MKLQYLLKRVSLCVIYISYLLFNLYIFEVLEKCPDANLTIPEPSTVIEKINNVVNSVGCKRRRKKKKRKSKLGSKQ